MKKNILLILSFIFILSSCAGMLDQYSHTAIPPDAVVEKDLPSVRTGMYNRVQEAPGTLTYVIFDFVGGDINQKEYTPKQLIDAQLKSGSTMSGEWNGFYSALYQVNNTMYIANRFPSSSVAKTTLGEALFPCMDLSESYHSFRRCTSHKGKHSGNRSQSFCRRLLESHL